MTQSDKLAVANGVLASFSKSQFTVRGHAYVTFPYRGKLMTKRWMCRGNDFYPVWHRYYPGGGTSVTALSQLIRWVQDKPVLPMSTWRYWSSETCKLLPVEAVQELEDGGYPVHVNCVLCHNQIEGSLDWWSLNGVSGPCCGWTSGCRQKGVECSKESCSI